MKLKKSILMIAITFVLVSFLTGCSSSIPETVYVVGVSIPEGDQTVEESHTEQLTAAVVPVDATNKTVIWASDSPDVATVNDNGLVMAIAVGKVHITVTTEEGGFSDTVEITVVPNSVEVTGVVIPEGDQTLFLGVTKQLTAVVEPSNATNKAVIWTSDFTDVATVDQNGLVTTMVVGKANIIVTTEEGGFTATVEITVVDPIII
jgi:uncharacterized protein YjdB